MRSHERVADMYGSKHVWRKVNQSEKSVAYKHGSFYNNCFVDAVHGPMAKPVLGNIVCLAQCHFMSVICITVSADNEANGLRCG